MNSYTKIFVVLMGDVIWAKCWFFNAGATSNAAGLYWMMQTTDTYILSTLCSRSLRGEAMEKKIFFSTQRWNSGFNRLGVLEMLTFFFFCENYKLVCKFLLSLIWLCLHSFQQSQHMSCQMFCCCSWLKGFVTLFYISDVSISYHGPHLSMSSSCGQWKGRNNVEWHSQCLLSRSERRESWHLDQLLNAFLSCSTFLLFLAEVTGHPSKLKLRQRKRMEIINKSKRETEKETHHTLAQPLNGAPSPPQ